MKIRQLIFVLPGLLLGYPPASVSGEVEDELEDEFALLEEAAVVESAARHKQEIGMSPSAITVITREDIAASGATTIPDLLRLVPGMDVIVTSAMYAQVTSRLYWTDEGQHYLVLVDGREANIELLGFPVWTSLPIFLEDIERIEVIRGPGSSLYGANALAGVISITTRGVPGKDSGWVRISGGEVGNTSAGARAATRVGDWGFSLAGGFDSAGDFSDHRATGRNCWMIRSVIEYRLSESTRLLLDGGISRTEGPLSTAMGDLDGSTSFRT
jgi:outer membrane cobalamin receptor